MPLIHSADSAPHARNVVYVRPEPFSAQSRSGVRTWLSVSGSWSGQYQFPTLRFTLAVFAEKHKLGDANGSDDRHHVPSCRETSGPVAQSSQHLRSKISANSCSQTYDAHHITGLASAQNIGGNAVPRSSVLTRGWQPPTASKPARAPSTCWRRTLPFAPITCWCAA